MKLIYTSLFFLLFSTLSAQTDTEFWFVAPEVDAGDLVYDTPTFFRFSTFGEASTVTVTQPANSAFVPIVLTIAANATGSINLSSLFSLVENTPANAVLNKGFLIQSTTPITAYYEVLGQCQCNPELFVLKGGKALGTDFYVPFQTLLPNGNSTLPTARAAFDIVATQNNTTVTILPTKNIVGHIANVPFNINLNKGQTYSGVMAGSAATDHASGSRIQADKPIAVILNGKWFAKLNTNTPLLES